MNRVLDIAPLRSFVAVAGCGGFQRAAQTLPLSVWARFGLRSELVRGTADALRGLLSSARPLTVQGA